MIPAACYQLPPDMFSRHAAVVQRLQALAGEAKTVVDIGGAHGALAAFLPDWQVLAVDPHLSDDQAGVRGTATKLPFGDGAFAFATCIDVLEHLPSDQREAALNEALRVCSVGGVLTFPFASERARIVERHLRSIRTSPAIEAFLMEHETHGLPERKEVEAMLKATGCAYRIDYATSPEEWALYQALEEGCSHLEQGAEFFRRLSTLANDDPSQVAWNAYRLVVTLRKEGMAAIAAPSPLPSIKTGPLAEALEGLSKTLGQVRAASSGALDERNRVIDDLQGQLADHQAEVTRLQEAYDQLQQVHQDKEAEAAAAKESYASLEAERAKAMEELASVRQAYEAQEEHSKTLAEAHAILEKDYGALEASHQELDEGHKQLQEGYAKLEKQYKANEEQRREQHAMLLKFKKHHEKTQGELKAHKDHADQLGQKYRDIEKLYNEAASYSRDVEKALKEKEEQLQELSVYLEELGKNRLSAMVKAATGRIKSNQETNRRNPEE